MNHEWIITDLKTIRREKNISLKGLAGAINIKPETLEAYEKLQNDPKLHTVSRWAAALGYEFDLVLMERQKEAAE